MNDQGYLILGYAVGLAMLWGHGLSLWLGCRRLRNRERAVRGVTR